MRRRWVLSLVIGVSLAASVAPSLSAPAPEARITVDATFDRKSVLPGQIAVMEIRVRNLGPDPARGLVVQARVAGAELLRARTITGSCGRPSGRVHLRCSLSALQAGSGARIEVVAKARRAGSKLFGSAWVIRRSTQDPGQNVDRDTASVRVLGRPVPSSYTELSFLLEAPSTVLAGRPFRAVLRLLNRGPERATVDRVSIVPAPRIPVVLSRIPRRLAVGQERTVFARITPDRVGQLRLNIRVADSEVYVARIAVRAS